MPGERLNARMLECVLLRAETADQFDRACIMRLLGKYQFASGLAFARLKVAQDGVTCLSLVRFVRCRQCYSRGRLRASRAAPPRCEGVARQSLRRLNLHFTITNHFHQVALPINSAGPFAHGNARKTRAHRAEIAIEIEFRKALDYAKCKASYF